jgi:hypothetical protein
MMIRQIIYFFLLAAALIALYLACYGLFCAARSAFAAYTRFRGRRVVVCPETRKYVAVEVDARHAAASAARGRAPELVLRSCTRWPERAGCEQDCVGQIERAPADCLVRTMLDEWYAQRACHFCGRGFGHISWADHKPALLSPEHLIVEWKEIPPERVPGALRTHGPVCWDCSVAESFRAEFPELVTDRDSKVWARV